MMDQTMRTAKFHHPLWRAGNALVGVMARVGIGPIHLLTTDGRRSGRPSTVPVVPVDEEGKRWLVAPYGAVDWVRNARAAGRVSLRHGRARHQYATRELTAGEAAPVLKRYVTIAPKTRRQFQAASEDPAEAFQSDAEHHPVFELIEISA